MVREAQPTHSCGLLVVGQVSGLRAQDGIFWHLGRGLRPGGHMSGPRENVLDFAVGVLVGQRAKET